MRNFGGITADLLFFKTYAKIIKRGDDMRLLVVEDEKNLNKTITERLEKAGYTADGVFDGEDALYYIENTHYDGIILDVMIPKINGFDVLKKIRGKTFLRPF